MSLEDLDYREESYSKDSFTSPLKDGMIGKFIITDLTYPYSYLKKLKETNEIDRKEAEYLEEDFTETKPDAKLGGFAIRCCLLSYDTDEGTMNTVSHNGDEDKWELNDKFNVFTEIDMLPVDQIFTKATATGHKYGDVYRLGGDNVFGDNGIPKTYNMFPSVKTVKSIMQFKSARGNLSEDEVKKIKADYEKRAEIWKGLIEAWKGLDDQQARRFLMNRLARRIMLYDPDITEGKVKYLDPQPGIIFQAKIRKQEDSNYFRIVVLEWDKNGGKWFVNNYGMPPIKVTDKTAKQAKDLKALDYNK